MIRFLFRLLGLLCLAAAFLLVIYDGTKSIAGNAVFITSVRNALGADQRRSLQALRPLIEGIAGGSVGPGVRDVSERAELGRPGHPRRRSDPARPQEAAADRLRAD